MARKPATPAPTPSTITPGDAISLLTEQLSKLKKIQEVRPIDERAHGAWENSIRELLIMSFGSASQNVDDIVKASNGPIRWDAALDEVDGLRLIKAANQVALLERCIEQLKLEAKLQDSKGMGEGADRAALLEEIFVTFLNRAELVDAEQFAIDHQDKIEAYDSLLRDGTINQTGGKLEFSLRSYVESKFWAKDEALLNRLIPTMKEMYSDKKGTLHEVSDFVQKLKNRGMIMIKPIDIERALRLFSRVGLLGGHNDVKEDGAIRIKSFSISQSILRCKTIADQVKHYLGTAQTISSAMTIGADMVAAPAKDNKKVFIVHGHDGKAREAVAQLIKKLDLDPIILHEQANQGDTVIEKFERNANVGFAIILMTSDDTGKANSEAVARPRARQNVVFEWGYFVGRLGRKRVCALYEPGIDLPSDLNGIVYISLDATGHWRLGLLKELKAAGYSVDANTLLE